MKSSSKYQVLVGKKFGKWSVSGPIKRKEYRTQIFCKCECGKNKWIDPHNLIKNKTKSCGCSIIKHGFSYNMTYRSWFGMISRCNNPKNKFYKRYGGRGITVYKEWLDFEKFYRDVGEKPNSKYSLDRINNDGNYEPGNVRWATRVQQNNNRSNSIKYFYKNKIYTITELAKIFGISRDALTLRIHKKSKLFNLKKVKASDKADSHL